MKKFIEFENNMMQNLHGIDTVCDLNKQQKKVDYLLDVIVDLYLKNVDDFDDEETKYLVIGAFESMLKNLHPDQAKRIQQVVDYYGIKLWLKDKIYKRKCQCYYQKKKEANKND